MKMHDLPLVTIVRPVRPEKVNKCMCFFNPHKNLAIEYSVSYNIKQNNQSLLNFEQNRRTRQ